MPEHTHDPIHDLENFGTGGLTVTPMDPAQVRRLGDRRRNRRRGVIAVAAAVVAVAGAVTPIALLSGNDGSDQAPSTHTPSPTPTPSATASGTTPPVITYPGAGVMVTSAADVDQLHGTTQAFQTFIGGLAEKAAQDGADCPDAAHGITVQKYSSAGYALGGVNTCGGYAALWATTGGRWSEALGTQDAWDCGALRYLDIPTSFAGECFDEAGDFGPKTVSGLRLGMNEAQLAAAGVTLQPGSADSCRGLVLPGRTPERDTVDGWLSPTKGLVGIFATVDMRTPEKIGLGSTRAQVETAYPDATHGIDFWAVPLGNGSQYEIGFNEDGTVRELGLTYRIQDCFG